MKRWGQLSGKVVPIEFELLHKASLNGNEGKFKTTLLILFMAKVAVFLADNNHIYKFRFLEDNYR